MTTLPTPALTAPWIAYGLFVAVLLAAVAAAGESVLRASGRPARWIWAAALGLTVVMVAIAPGRSPRPASSALDALPPAAAVAAVAAPHVGWGARALGSAAAGLQRLAEPARWLVDATARAVPPSFDRLLGVAWLVLAVAVLTLFAIVYARFARARTRWPLARLHGTQVRVAPDAGPAVVGLARPEIVVPEWLLERSTDEQRLVLTHETEHLAARDPLLLAAACVAAALIPWNPAAWWMLSRLRLAVELDCDARVLRRGVAPRSYGSLLIDLAGRCSGLRIGAPALADESSHLHQRIIAMTVRTSRVSFIRTAAACAFAAVAILAACEAKLPTQTEVNDMTAASATASAQKLSLMSKDTLDAQYQVDGAFVSAAEANAIAPARIASIEITKGPSAPNGKGLVSIRTRAPGDTTTGYMLTKRIESNTAAPEPTVTAYNLPRRHLDYFAGIILVDGVRVSEAAMQALPPSDIVSVKVVKGPSAAKLYDAPEAANGVIVVTTKKYAPKK